MGIFANVSAPDDSLTRYARQIALPEVGLAGQKRLRAARVLCLGAGGLGSPAALYLAAAGVGTIGLVDADVVDLSNLHRQLLHGSSDVGRPKLDSARDRLREVNPSLHLETHQTRFTAANAADLVARYDLVIDGSDNLPTRYLSSDVCVWARKPNIYGAVHRFEGQLSVFAPHLGAPCYRCLFPDPPPADAIPSCAEAGVLGAVPGLVGTLQALEAMKIILQYGEPLLGRLLHIDATQMRFREFSLRRDPSCPVCGTKPTITAPIDYEQFCRAQTDARVPEISVTQLHERLQRNDKIALLDVREPYEFEIARLPDATLIPLGELPERFRELAAAQELVVLCKSGVRSARAVEFLRENGFRSALNLAGGIDAWRAEIDPALPKY
ncbi:MAG: molybdopterin-synthase adenylyltransferase MoeB [Verrucomicrobiota bacterium]|nr:molybdopterin-synthase adenylyltransferase MoeB [Verrucomicrobiota bacterium]